MSVKDPGLEGPVLVSTPSFHQPLPNGIGYQKKHGNAGHLVLLSVCCINMLIIKRSILAPY